MLIFAADDIGNSFWSWGHNYNWGSEVMTEASEVQVTLFYESLEESYGQSISSQALILEKKD